MGVFTRGTFEGMGILQFLVARDWRLGIRDWRQRGRGGREREIRE